MANALAVAKYICNFNTFSLYSVNDI
jgi:hypothetical protein